MPSFSFRTSCWLSLCPKSLAISPSSSGTKRDIFPPGSFSNLSKTRLTSKIRCAGFSWSSHVIALSLPFCCSLPGDHKILKGRKYALTLPVAKFLVYNTYVSHIVLFNHYLFLRDKIEYLQFPDSHPVSTWEISGTVNLYVHGLSKCQKTSLSYTIAIIPSPKKLMLAIKNDNRWWWW